MLPSPINGDKLKVKLLCTVFVSMHGCWMHEAAVMMIKSAGGVPGLHSTRASAHQVGRYRGRSSKREETHVPPDVDGDGLGLQALEQAVAGGPLAARTQLELAVPDETLPVVHVALDAEPLRAIEPLQHLQAGLRPWKADRTSSSLARTKI